MNSHIVKKWGHWLVLLAIFAIVALVFQQIATSFVEQGVASGDALSNAALFPRYIAIAIALLGAIVAIQMVVKGAPDDVDEDGQGLNPPVETARHLRALEIGMVALTILYLLLLEPLGFHLSTFFVIGAMFYLLGARPLLLALLASAGLTLVSSFVFEGLLKVVLPLGAFNLSIPYHLVGL